MQVSGQCLCGGVRYRAETAPQFQVKWYCTDCRKTSAAGHAAMMGFPAVTISGEIKEYHSKANSGADVTRAFCPNCGAGVYSKNASMPDMIFLRASTLDEPNLSPRSSSSTPPARLPGIRSQRAFRPSRKVRRAADGVYASCPSLKS